RDDRPAHRGARSRRHDTAARHAAIRRSTDLRLVSGGPGRDPRRERSRAPGPDRHREPRRERRAARHRAHARRQAAGRDGLLFERGRFRQDPLRRRPPRERDQGVQEPLGAGHTFQSRFRHRLRERSGPAPWHRDEVARIEPDRGVYSARHATETRDAGPSVKDGGRVLVGLGAGLAGGFLIGASHSSRLIGLADAVAPVGTLWVNAIRMTVIPLVVALLITGVASASDISTFGRIGGRTIAVFIAMLAGATLLALPLGIGTFSWLSHVVTARPELPPGAADAAASVAAGAPAASFAGRPA